MTEPDLIMWYRMQSYTVLLKDRLDGSIIPSYRHEDIGWVLDALDDDLDANFEGWSLLTAP